MGRFLYKKCRSSWQVKIGETPHLVTRDHTLTGKIQLYEKCLLVRSERIQAHTFPVKRLLNLPPPPTMTNVPNLHSYLWYFQNNHFLMSLCGPGESNYEGKHNNINMFTKDANTTTRRTTITVVRRPFAITTVQPL